MACDSEILRQVPLFALLDDEEVAVLAEQVELAHFAPRQRIYKINDPGDQAYVMVSGAVQVTTIARKLTLLHDKIADLDDLFHEQFSGSGRAGRTPSIT